jgi:2',3'-cyclic-nucleotide 2'-phosphodiesterase (5'-nucleotidase family)
MQKFILLHSNDIHGRIDALARIATLVAQTRAENPGIPVLYLDGGDCEETSQRLSNLTKGVAMYRLLRAAGCMVATIGNGGLPRYGQHILTAYAHAARFPLLLANLRNADGSLLEGVQATTLLDVGTCKLGIIGVSTSNLGGDAAYEQFFGLQVLPLVELIRELAAELRAQGAHMVVLLSHLGLPEDVTVAMEVGKSVPLIIGAHTHSLAPAGIWNGPVLIAQAGEFAQYLGRLDLVWDGEYMQTERVCVLPVTADIPPSPQVQAELVAIETDVEQMLHSVIGELAAPLDFSTHKECGTANLLADALRARLGARVAVVTAAMAPNGPLAAGPLQRVTLWELCSSSANPGVVELTGAQLQQLVQRGLDPALAADRPRANRGNPRGLMHLSGASMRHGQLYIGSQAVAAEQRYTVASSDWELGSFGGYADPAWNLQPSYEVQTIMRDVIEDYIKERSPVAVEMGRLDLAQP